MISLSRPLIEADDIEAVVAVMKSGMIAQGPKTAELEAAFATYCGTKYAVAFNSGTAAIHAGLNALGVQAGDEVITSPFTFVATANPILMQNAKVVFADISAEDFMLDPKQVEAKLSPATKTIMPVDLYGQIYQVEDISQLAAQATVSILEDACQSVGAEHAGKRAGHFGQIAAFSLYATKNLISGEGGLITTNDEELVEKCKRFRHHGQSEKTRYEYWELGYNYRMTDMAAAIAVSQLKKLEDLTARRIKNAAALTAGLKSVPGIITPTTRSGDRHVFHQYTIRITPEYGHSRDELLAHLKTAEIGSGVYYPKPLHLHPHFGKLGYQPGDFPVAEAMAKEVLSLPVHPQLSAADTDKIIQAIQNYAG